MTLRVAVLTEDPDGPSARHRWVYPARRLREEGIDVTLHAVEPPSARPAAFRAAAGADLTVLHRKLFRRPDRWRLRRAARRIVYDLDDAVMYRPSGRRRQRSVLRGLRFSRTVSIASLFVAGNRYLERCAPLRVPTLVLPTPVDLERYVPRDSWPERGRVVGWIGTAATLPYLRLAAPALASLASRRDDLVLRVIGPEPGEVPGVPREHVPWSEAGEAEALRDLDVGILPLPDDPWTRGKCAFKALQYMAAGIPVVASPVGVNPEVVEEGRTGLLPRTEAEWEEALDRLLDDRERRRALGAAGRARAAERYAVSVLAPRLAKALSGVAR